MAAKNSSKLYVENGYYHIYNRGVEKRPIFQDDQDYGVYLSYLRNYLSPKNEEELLQQLQAPNISGKEKDQILKIIHLNNFNQEITLLAYCLMPNHFHLFIQQKSPGSIDKFMNSLCSRYASYFNRKYKRVGALFQGVYKAVLVTNEAQYLHISRYINLQALALQGTPLKDGQPSSYPEYIGTRNTPWVHPEEILSFFSKSAPALSYESFVRDYAIYSSLGDLALEDD